MRTELRNGIAVHKFPEQHYRRASATIDVKQLQVEFARTAALLALTSAMVKLPSKKSNLLRMAEAARHPEASLETLREISNRLTIVTAAASGVRTEHRSIRFNAQTRAVGGTSRVITFLASTDGLDRHGTKVMPQGINIDRYMQNPIVLFGHDGYGGWFSTPDPANIIGRSIAVRKTDTRLEADIEFLPGEVNPNAEMIFQMVKAKALNAVSIGFIPREVKTELDPANPNNEIPIITKSELLEISVVPIPSNPDALASGGRATKPVRTAFAY